MRHAGRLLSRMSGGTLPKWVSRKIVGLVPEQQVAFSATRLLVGGVSERDRVQLWSNRTTRALALRNMLTQRYKSSRRKQTLNPPQWMRQMAVVATGAVPLRPPRLEAFEDERSHPPLQLGTMLLAPTKTKRLTAQRHGEAVIIDRLRREPPDALAKLSPLIFYSLFCPCCACAEIIAGFAASNPALKIEVVYEREWVPEDENRGWTPGQAGDATNVARMRAAGVAVDSLERLVWIGLIEAVEDAAIEADIRRSKR